MATSTANTKFGCVTILNLDKDNSTLSASNVISNAGNSTVNDKSFIVSDAELFGGVEELTCAIKDIFFDGYLDRM